jgi:hypothetical protein
MTTTASGRPKLTSSRRMDEGNDDLLHRFKMELILFGRGSALSEWHRSYPIGECLVRWRLATFGPPPEELPGF